ncbi:Nif3-like dinuclear metal center hexameric protein [Listeria costaricensis]|uniref:Nif3-like dinuclear metal center hexameric protein n=1 Tax=Listeria costaricensis TaxID=2026604 RepID=UPI000C075533|nr:Nif3-like dinuclear metal center hexameric protein [Listeria costaricensis]
MVKIIDAIQMIIEKSQAQAVDETKTIDQVIIGDVNQELTGIVTTFMATIDVIKEADQLGANFIITHEPTWFNGRDRTAWLLEDAVYEEKLALIKSKGITIWRFHDYMHMGEKDLIYAGFEEALGWKGKTLTKNPASTNILDRSEICYEIEEMASRELIEQLKNALGNEPVRFIGAKDARSKRIGVLLGGSSLGLGDETNPMQLIQARELDTVICGDITEWTISAYIRDAVQLGQNKSMIVLGHERSEEIGMKALNKWLEGLSLGTAIHFVDSKEPFEYC